MLSHEQSPLAHTSYFGIDIMRSTPEVANLPPVESAAQTLARAVREGDGNQIVAIETAERHLGKILTVTEDRDGIDMHLTDLFTADQLHEMIRRVTTYLGKSLDAHIEEPGRPTGFDFYVKRLGFHFGSGDDDVTSSFGAFELHHESPTKTAIGPHEGNSRSYALLAIDRMQQQFSDYYQTGLTFKLGGPTKIVNGSRVPERGIAESQFLIMDYTRDLLAQENATRARSHNGEVMTLQDIETNIRILLTQRNSIRTELLQINPIIADQLDVVIVELNKQTIGVMHRGRPGVPKFRRDPNPARRLLTTAETLLMHAEAMSETRSGEEEIPIIEIP